jgi:hypothetical protein
MEAAMDEKRVVEVRESGGGGFGIVGVIIGALLVIGVIFFFTGGMDRIAGTGGSSGSGPSVTVNTGSPAPAAPSTPARPAAPSSTTGSTPSR